MKDRNVKQGHVEWRTLVEEGWVEEEGKGG
jgi:hypothetical protein